VSAKKLTVIKTVKTMKSKTNMENQKFLSR